jgi:hypothetical protein
MRKIRPREGDIQRTILAWLDLHRVPHFRNNTGATRLPGRGGKPMLVRFGSPGWPDIVAVGPGGILVGIECKRPLGPRGGASGSTPDPAQRAVGEAITSAGGAYIVARCLSDVIDAWSHLAARGLVARGLWVERAPDAARKEREV